MTYEEMIDLLLREAVSHQTSVEVVMTRSQTLDGILKHSGTYFEFHFNGTLLTQFSPSDVRELTIRRVGVGFTLYFRQS